MAGHGRNLDFHGKFKSKTAAKAKEQEVGEGAFILKVRGYYYVLSRKGEN